MPITAEAAGVLLERIRAGDQAAWSELVDSYMGLVWGIARNHRLNQGDAADVAQTTWLRLIENLDRIQDPARIGAWLATTARRECLRLLRLSGRQLLVDDERQLDGKNPEALPVDALMISAEEAALMRLALDRLPPRCQHLLRLLMVEDPPSYEELSAALDMPVGSIGPTRGRCLEKLRALVLAEGLVR